MRISLNQLPEGLAEIPVNMSVVVHCQGGSRSAIAASLLEKHGYDNVLNLVGGYKSWSMTAAT